MVWCSNTLFAELFETFNDMGHDDTGWSLDIPPMYQSSDYMIRDSRGSYATAFQFMASQLLPIVAGNMYWGREKYHKLMSHGGTLDCNGLPLVSVSDEGFTRFFYENYLERWKCEYSINRYKMEEVDRERLPDPKYTLSRSGNVAYGGWSEAGLQRFNELCFQVQQDREKDKDGAVEKILLQKLQNTPAGKKAVGKTQAAVQERAVKKRKRVAAFVG